MNEESIITDYVTDAIVMKIRSLVEISYRDARIIAQYHIQETQKLTDQQTESLIVVDRLCVERDKLKAENERLQCAIDFLSEIDSAIQKLDPNEKYDACLDAAKKAYAERDKLKSEIETLKDLFRDRYPDARALELIHQLRDEIKQLQTQIRNQQGFLDRPL